MVEVNLAEIKFGGAVGDRQTAKLNSLANFPAIRYMVDMWEIRKHKLYDSDSGSGLQLHTQSSPGERSGKFRQNGKFGQNGKFSQNHMSGQKGKVHFGPNVSSSAHDCGCVVDGGGAMAAI